MLFPPPQTKQEDGWDPGLLRLYIYSVLYTEIHAVLVFEGKRRPFFSVSRYFPEKKEGGPSTRKFVYRSSFFLLFVRDL